MSSSVAEATSLFPRGPLGSSSKPLLFAHACSCSRCARDPVAVRRFAEMLFIGNDEVKSAGGFLFRQCGLCLSDKCRVETSFAPSFTEIACDFDAGIIGMFAPHCRGYVL